MNEKHLLIANNRLEKRKKMGRNESLDFASLCDIAEFEWTY